MTRKLAPEVFDPYSKCQKDSTPKAYQINEESAKQNANCGRVTTATHDEDQVQHTGRRGGLSSWLHKIDPLKQSSIPPVPHERMVSREHGAAVLSLLYFQWMGPLLSVGYQRTLSLNDIWSVNPDRSVEKLAAAFQSSLAKHRVEKSRIDPLVRALYDTFKTDFIIGGLSQLVAGLCQVLTPFVLRYLIAFVQEVYDATFDTRPAPSIGRGVGLVIGIACMQLLQSVCINQYYYRGMMLGGQARSTIIACVLQKTLKISNRARAGCSDDDREAWSNAKINNLMSTDTSRIDSACVSIHRCWMAPIQIALALALLCINLTYSALVGFGLFCTAIPLLSLAVGALMKRRTAINELTDQRIHLTQETFSAIRIVKFFAWESKLVSRLTDVRNRESLKISHLLMLRNAILATAVAMPILASTLTFITYSLSGHTLSAAPIFSSLALFNALGVPLEILPSAIGRTIDALASVKRLGVFLAAEETSVAAVQDNTQRAAVKLSASFIWEHQTSLLARDQRSDEKQQAGVSDQTKSSDATPGSMPFSLVNIDLSIDRQEFVAIVGTIGSGKSSLLAAIGGDMRKTEGSMSFGGTIAMCSQQPWIQNAPLKQNITFGKAFDECRYKAVVEACALTQDIATLPFGDDSEIGERGVTLSGGQKQRVNIARAIYFDADIVLMDDPLSAVDAHVGRHVVDHAICGLLRHKCRILATHQLHVLPRADKIVWLQEGRIYKSSTYAELIANSSAFQELMATSKESQGPQTDPDEQEHDLARESGLEQVDTEQEDPKTSGGRQRDVAALMQVEEQAQGSVSWAVYLAFATASGSVWNITTVVLVLAIAQGTNIISSVWLSWWTSHRFGDLGLGQYIGIYAALGVAQALFMFIFATTLTTLGCRASRSMLNQAASHTIRAPVSFFDTTPLGRIINRFSKDVDAMDNSLIDDLRFLLYILATVFSVFCLVIAYYHYFAVALVPLLLVWIYLASYYRASAREIKRHETVLRSSVFARFSEVLTGIPTIRAYRVQQSFLATIMKSLDSMDGAYFLTFASQRWLSTRLDAIGAALLFVMGMLIVTSRLSINPSIGGVVLAYMLGIVQLMQETVHVFADVENSMISAERLFYHGRYLEQEGLNSTRQVSMRARPIPLGWPHNGCIQFRDVQMRYRPGLPLVLKGLSLEIQPGDRIGIVGRTGAGKSSIIAALFRLVELAGGGIFIDGENIADLPLSTLRSSLSIIPQDPTLFKGTVRSNLDPFDEHQDIQLWEALRQVGLARAVQNSPCVEKSTHSVTLETPVEDDGLNFSLGQRQLLALARVLIKNTPIVLFDEATSSVDFETDVKVQRTISQSFNGKTLLCIAHRLQTILAYDRILVMNDGQAAEYESPLALYDQGGLFRSMCEKSGIIRSQIGQE